MAKDRNSHAACESRASVYMKYVLLAVCLCAMAVRATFVEGPAIQSASPGSNLGDSTYSLVVSTLLIFSFVLWLVWSLCSGNFSYRIAGMEIGLGLLCVACIAAGCAAADKRLALTTITVLLAPPLMAMLLVQILDGPAKVRLVLIAIAALGAVSACQCADQFFFSNEAMIEQYEQDPQSMLAPLGVEPGTLQQFMFEHRLYSGGVRGFFTTRNSAGSFALMAFAAAVALFADKLRHRGSDPAGRKYLLGCGLVAAVILVSLLMTRSKGAIAGLFFAAAAFAVLLLFGRSLRRHRKAILAICVLAVVAGSFALAQYGLRHSRLPGGSSMLVRWQYWQASAKMYADHPLAGVGPGNFTHYYPRYKPAEALESVADPHNFPLSLLTQYGPLGLLGLLAMIFIPLWKTTSPAAPKSPAQTSSHSSTFRTLATAFAIVISASLLILRPLLMRTPLGDSPDVMIYLIVTMYVAPAAVFVVGFALLAGPLGRQIDTIHNECDNLTIIALSCAVLGVLLHNLTDFAIFEPGVSTTFWVMIACIVAISSRSRPNAFVLARPTPVVKAMMVAAALALTVVYLSYVLVPVASSTADIEHANQAVSAGQFDSAHRLFDQAAEDDPLSAAALSFDGRLYLHHFELTQGRDPDLLRRAVESLQAAISRNNASFKDFERLTDTYRALADLAKEPDKADWLNKAFEAAGQAIERYPGCERLHFKLAQIAEQQGKSEAALDHYRKAVEIEDAYRAQFRLMYPERQEVVSRMGEEAYQYAIKRVKALSAEPQKLPL